MTLSPVASERIVRSLVRLTLPVLAEQLLHMLVMYVDMWLAGNYLQGEAPLAAINLASYTMWMIFTLFLLVSVGATAVTARFVGAGNYRGAQQVMNQSLLIGALEAAAIMLLGFLGVDAFVSLLQLEGPAHEMSVRYLTIVLFAMPAIMIEEVGIACLRGAGDMVSGLVIMGIVNGINVLASFALLRGWGPLPELGWVGLAYGTAIGHIVGGLLMLWLLILGRARMQLRLSLLKPDPDLIRRILRIGIPGGVNGVSIVLCHLWYLSIINTLGDLAAAAHGIGVRIEALAYMPGSAFQVAVTTLTGQYLGAGDSRRAGRSVILACLVGGSVMVLAAVMFYLFAVPLSTFFAGSSDMSVVKVSSELVRIAAFSVPALALMMILSGALSGAGDTRWPLLFTFIGFLLVRIPLAYLLATDSFQIPLADVTIEGYGLGVYGAWYAMISGVVVRCLLICGRFLSGAWKKIEV